MGDLHGFLKGSLINFVVRSVKKMVPAFSLSGFVRFNAMLSEAQQASFKPVSISATDVAFLQYTGEPPVYLKVQRCSIVILLPMYCRLMPGWHQP
jgi:hypothetical protein